MNIMNINNLKTGDILLFDENPSNCAFKSFTSLIKCWTHSIFSHCAFVLKDPFNKKGIYIWESSYHGNQPRNERKFGVQITPIEYYLNDYPGKVTIYVRRRDENNPIFTNSFLKKVFDVVHDMPYDINICDWLSVAVGNRGIKTIRRFWCSALLGYILTMHGDLEKDTDWSMLRACDFSSTSENLTWLVKYHDNELIGTF